MSIPGTVPITGPIAPTDVSDLYPTHFSIYGLGGHREVADLVARDAISVDRRAEGMLCYVVSDGNTYQLQGGILNANWALFSSSGGGSLQNAYDASPVGNKSISLDSAVANQQLRVKDNVVPLVAELFEVTDSLSAAYYFAVQASGTGIGTLPAAGRKLDIAFSTASVAQNNVGVYSDVDQTVSSGNNTQAGYFQTRHSGAATQATMYGLNAYWYNDSGVVTTGMGFNNRMYVADGTTLSGGYGSYNLIDFQGASTGGTVIGLYNYVLTESGSTAAVTNAGALYNYVRNLGNGNMTAAVADNNRVHNEGTGTITTATGVQNRIVNLDVGGTITTATGVRVGNWVNNGTIDTSYGLYIDADTNVGTTAWSIYSGSTAPSYLAGNLTVAGNLHVTGEVVSIDKEQVLIGDNHLYLNYGYTTAVAQTGGLAINYLPSGTVLSIAAPGFTAGVVGVSNPTVELSGATVLTPGQFIQISGAANEQNNGLYELLSVVGTTMTMRGVGTTSTVEDFTQTDFVTDATVQGSITPVSVSVLRCGTDGVWESAYGSGTPLTFADLVSSLSLSLQAAYNGSPTTARTIVVAGSPNEGVRIRNNAVPISSNLFEVTDNAGTAFSLAANTLGVGIGAAPVSGNRLVVDETTTTTAGPLSAIRSTLTASPAGGGNADYWALSNRLNYTTAQNNFGSLRGINNVVDVQAGVNIVSVVGVRAENIFSAATIATSDCFNATLNFDNAATNVSVARCFTAEWNHSAGSATNLYGFYIADNTLPGFGTNKYGIWVSNISGASGNNYALLTNSGTVRFGDNVLATQKLSVGTTSQVYQLMVESSIAAPAGPFYCGTPGGSVITALGNYNVLLGDTDVIGNGTSIRIEDSLQQITSTAQTTLLGDGGAEGNNTVLSIYDATETVSVKAAYGMTIGADSTPYATLYNLGSFGSNIQTVAVNTVIGNGNAGDQTFTLKVDASGGNVQITLPAVASNLRRIICIKVIATNLGANTVSVIGTAGETIDGAASLSSNTDYDAWIVQADSTGWSVLSK